MHGAGGFLQGIADRDSRPLEDVDDHVMGRLEKPNISLQAAGLMGTLEITLQVNSDISPMPYRPGDFNNSDYFVKEILEMGTRIVQKCGKRGQKRQGVKMKRAFTSWLRFCFSIG